MLKIMLFAFLSCGVVSAASAMGAWMVQPGGIEFTEGFFTAADFNLAFLLSAALISSVLAAIYFAVHE